MTAVTGLTAARMLEIEAESVVDGNVVGDNLILVKHDGSTIDAGNVRGAAGATGPPAPQLMVDSVGASLQEGIISGGTITRLSASSVRIAAGSAWINGDSISGFGNGLYPVSWAQTDITGIPVTGAGPANRLDQFIVTLTGTPFDGTASVSRLAGAEQGAGTTLELRAGAAAVPNGAMRLADILMDASGVPVLSTTNSRDRRPWAKGASYRYESSTDGDVTTSSGSYVDADATKLSPRLEVAAGNVLMLEWDGVVISGSSAILYMSVGAGSGGAVSPNTSMRSGNRYNSFPASVDDWNAEFHKSLSYTVTSSGSIIIRCQMNSSAGTAETLKRASGYPTMFRVRELIIPSGNNGMGG